MSNSEPMMRLASSGITLAPNHPKWSINRLNISWLKTGFGDMLVDEPALEYPNSDMGGNMVAMVRMMQEFIQLGKKNADANLINAEANKLNAQNLDRLITLLEHKFD